MVQTMIDNQNQSYKVKRGNSNFRSINISKATTPAHLCYHKIIITNHKITKIKDC